MQEPDPIVLSLWRKWMYARRRSVCTAHMHSLTQWLLYLLVLVLSLSLSLSLYIFCF